MRLRDSCPLGFIARQRAASILGCQCTLSRGGGSGGGGSGGGKCSVTNGGVFCRNRGHTVRTPVTCLMAAIMHPAKSWTGVMWDFPGVMAQIGEGLMSSLKSLNSTNLMVTKSGVRVHFTCSDVAGRYGGNAIH